MRRKDRAETSVTPDDPPSEDDVLNELIEYEPELQRLQQRALRLMNVEEAKQAARELLRRATEIQQYLGPILMDRPFLFEEDAPTRFTMPVTVALGRSHRYYYKHGVTRLRNLKLGSKTGVSCDERSNWKSDGEIGSWAVALYDTVTALRTHALPLNNVIKAYVQLIQRDHTEIAQAASLLGDFCSETANDWIRTACLPILYVLRPDLKPFMRPGRPRKTDDWSADPETKLAAKRKRDAIAERIRAMAWAWDKGHTWPKQRK